jgi:uncharacterized protein
MAPLTDSLDLARLSLSSGEARILELDVPAEPFRYGGQRYEVSPNPVAVRLDVSRTTGSGWALRLRLGAAVEGPCMRCLAPAAPAVEVDAREIEQPGGGDELSSPYVDDGELDITAWARDALALAMPAQVTCRPDCLGLCAQCGADLNEDPGHAHERAPDKRWAKLSELKFD